MRETLPPQWKSTTTLDTKIGSLSGVDTNVRSRLPNEVTTIRDLFVKRVEMPKTFGGYKSDIKGICDLLSLEADPEDVPVESIRTPLDLRLTLFAITQNGNIFTRQGDGHTIESFIGEDIYAVSDAMKVSAITRSKSLSHIGAPNPQHTAESILLVKGNDDDGDLYVLTTATADEVQNAYYDGLPEDSMYRIIYGPLVEQVCALFGLPAPIENPGMFNIHDSSVIRIDPPTSDGHAVIAPRTGLSLKKPWVEMIERGELEIMASSDILT